LLLICLLFWSFRHSCLGYESWTRQAFLSYFLLVCHINLCFRMALVFVMISGFAIKKFFPRKIDSLLCFNSFGFCPRLLCSAKAFYVGPCFRYPRQISSPFSLNSACEDLLKVHGHRYIICLRFHLSLLGLDAPPQASCLNSIRLYFSHIRSLRKWQEMRLAWLSILYCTLSHFYVGVNSNEKMVAWFFCSMV